MRACFFLLVVLIGCVCIANGQATKLWTEPKAGVWTVKGADEEKTHWLGRMHLAPSGRKGSTTLYRGYFFWWSHDSESKGYEYFKGSFDRATGVLKMHSSRVRNLRGKLGTGDYKASVRRGSQIYRGRWFGGTSIPGTWSANWRRGR